MKSKNKIDVYLLSLILILVSIGVIMVFSSSYYYALDKMGNIYYFLIKDVIWVFLGLAIMFVFVMIDYHVIEKISPVAYLIGLALLILVLTSFGVEINHARRWLELGGFRFQPSEVAKLCLIVFLAYSLSKNNNKINKFFKGNLPYLAMAVLYSALIIKQPNMSTSVIMILIAFAMLFVAGMWWRYLLGIIAAGIALGFYFIKSSPYRYLRFLSFRDPFADAADSGYQVIQSLYALGSGGLFGVGLGKGMQNKLYIPEPQNDFIFATIGEELGLIGCLIVMGLYMALIWKGVKIAQNAPDLFGTLLATGIVSMIAFQVMINIAVATSSMPVTGIPLPFISYGGSSMIILMTEMGILMNISKQGMRVAQ
ncbi:MAG: putative lipid II flippase FtsW [Peptostreptococcaceae bacterium]|nr:putative lipid II flippase FtsW [Peptostreptococcaceae bacterium]